MAVNPFDNIGRNIRTQANRAIQDVRNIAQQSVEQFVGNALNAGIGKVVGKLDSGIGNFFNSFGFAKATRSKNIPLGQVKNRTTAMFASNSDSADWRVRLSVPVEITAYKESRLLKPLIDQTGGHMVFPFTPTIIIGHSANYDALAPAHTNYPFPIYSNSQVDDIVVTGEFYVESEDDARYWLACVHYLRSVTKMNYGTDDENAGAPPPLVKLNGYGDYIFKNVPCVVTNFTVDLPADVDYVSASIEGGADSVSQQVVSSKVTWAPTQSQMSVTLRPTYSRRLTSSFNLKEFVNGDYLKNGGGFI
jgi:hypothetical protein